MSLAAKQLHARAAAAAANGAPRARPRAGREGEPPRFASLVSLRATVSNVESSLSCPICAPTNSADDADFLYYPPDEEIPVSLCKHVYGYPRGLGEAYELLEVLGEGSFGQVKRAVALSSGDFFAVKTVAKSRPTWTGGMDGGMREATTSTYLMKIQNEVNFLARLSDVETVVRLKKAYEDDSHVHLVMDLCCGGSLYDRMERLEEEEAAQGERGAFAAHFTEERVRRVMACVVRVLRSCHERGIIYRDIKPQNFLYVDDTPDAPLKCSDFGLAMSFIPGQPGGTSLDKRAGTPVYMAPELVLRRYDERADLWSAGVLMYQLLAGGRLPLWNGEIPLTANLDDIFFPILIKEIDFAPIARVSAEAADLCAKLLTRDPERRISAEEAAEHPWLNPA